MTIESGSMRFLGNHDEELGLAATLLTRSLNSSVSNSAWVIKKEAMLDASLLPITQRLRHYQNRDEQAIEQRGSEMRAGPPDLARPGLIPLKRPFPG
jgi:hypothetical protein